MSKILYWWVKLTFYSLYFQKNKARHLMQKSKRLFSPFPSSSFLISLCICDFALMCNSWPLFTGRPLSTVCTAWLGGWLNGRTSCWLASNLSVGDFCQNPGLVMEFFYLSKHPYNRKTCFWDSGWSTGSSYLLVLSKSS